MPSLLAHDPGAAGSKAALYDENAVLRAVHTTLLPWRLRMPGGQNKTPGTRGMPFAGRRARSWQFPDPIASGSYRDWHIGRRQARVTRVIEPSLENATRYGERAEQFAETYHRSNP